MPAASYFSFPLTQGPPSTLRASLYKPSRKRKRDEADADADADTDAGTTSGYNDLEQVLSEPGPYPTSSGPQSSAPSEAAFSKDVVNEYRTAGQPFDEGLPGGHFPHTPCYSTADTLVEPDAGARIYKDLAALKPPLYIPRDAGLSRNLGLRQQHVAVVTSVLHRSLLEGDYIRAGRAWGMLLRAEMNGRHMDLRTHGRWGIGAEILLRRDAQLAHRRSTGECGDDDDDSDPYSREQPADIFSEDGFNKARDYYERLILQYPYRKHNPRAINALDFYPAMFWLWIYSVQDRHKTALSRIHHSSEKHHRERTDEDLYTNTPPSSPSSERSEHGHATEEVRKSTLKQAEEITIRLEELLLSPPYSDDPALWILRGMVALWVGDLSVTAPPPTEANNSDEESKSSDDDTDGDNLTMKRLLARHEHERSLAKKTEHVEKAIAAFQNVIRRGGKLSEGLTHLVQQQDVLSLGGPEGI